MAKYKVMVRHMEVYVGAVIVEADSAIEASGKVAKAWGGDDREYLYDQIVDCPSSAHTTIQRRPKLATEKDVKLCVNL